LRVTVNVLWNVHKVPKILKVTVKD